MATQLEIAAAMGCPVRCDYCPQHLLDAAYKGTRMLTLETFARCLSNCPADMPVSFASFCEAFINRELPAMFGLLRMTGRPWQIFTTLYGASMEGVRAMCEARPHRITLHVPDAGGRMPLPKIAHSQYVNLMRAAWEGAGECGAAVEVLCFGRLPDEFAFLAASVRQTPLQSRAGNVWERPRLSGPIRCGQCPDLDYPTLLPDGTLVICCQDYKLQHRLGDLRTATIGEILRGAEATRIREAMAGDGECLCRYCDYARKVGV